MNFLDKGLQIILALGIALVLNLIAVYIMVKEDIVEDVTKLVSVPIFKGWVDTKAFTNKQFNTYNRFAKNYKKLPRSINRKGGAQFSYSVWVKFSNISSANLSKNVLFMRGDKTKYPYKVTIGNKTLDKNDYVIKCPLVRFGDNMNELVVEFNTSNDVSASATITKIDNDTDETVRHNIFSLVPDRWTLMTFVFEDNKEFGEAESGIEFSFYLNDILYLKQRYKGMMRLNGGDLIILPNSSIEGGYMADLTYYNYALSLYDVRKVLSRGVSPYRYNDMETDPDFNEPLYLTEYNKLEIYNL